MRRREFISLIGAAASCPVAALAQQPEDQARRVVVLMVGPESDAEQRAQVDMFHRALEQLGWNEGQNLKTYVRWGLSSVKNVVGLQPDAILAYPTNVVILLQKQTRSIPIVFVGVSDPLAQGIVTSLARPTGNITGFSNPQFSLVGKSLQILRDIAPNVLRVALIISATNGAAAGYFDAFHKFSGSFALTPVVISFNDSSDIERGVEEFSREPNGALFFPRDTATNLKRDMVVGLATQFRLPAVYAQREFVAAGGLISYGIDPNEPFQRAASYVDRILRGARPGDLPVQEPTRYELVINLKTAKALGLTIPLALQATADEVIE
jgi:putative tryptophan/tyrosine transport system substrate-binding protein